MDDIVVSGVVNGIDFDRERVNDWVISLITPKKVKLFAKTDRRGWIELPGPIEVNFTNSHITWTAHYMLIDEPTYIESIAVVDEAGSILIKKSDCIPHMFIKYGQFVGSYTLNF